MRGNELLDKMELIDHAYVEAADVTQKVKNRDWAKWSAIAACFCLVVVSAFALSGKGRVNTLQSWRDGYQAEDYFKFCKQSADGVFSSSACLDSSVIPYDESRWFSDDRIALEEESILPVIDTHPLFNFVARYNSDGSLYCVEIFWHRRDQKGIDNYSDLKVIAGYQEINIVNDCITIEIDEDGIVHGPAATVTKRDGIQIVARGREDTEKTLTFQSDKGWYQVSGSWNDDYESVVELLDWFWAHPLDFEQFPMEEGDNYIHSTLAEVPDAFADYLPDFSAFGFIEQTTSVSLKNGTPVRFEGHYVAHVTEEQVENQSFYDVDGFTTMHWCITSEPDVYDLEKCMGELENLTQEQVVHILDYEDNKVVFMQDGCLVTIYPKDSHEAWLLIESIQN